MELFTYDFYHLIHYIFILRDFRGFGYGSRMVAEMEQRFAEKRTRSRRPIRLQAGTRAVAFFEALGYRRVGVGKDSICCGTPLFRTLYNMVKEM